VNFVQKSLSQRLLQAIKGLSRGWEPRDSEPIVQGVWLVIIAGIVWQFVLPPGDSQCPSPPIIISFLMTKILTQRNCP